MIKVVVQMGNATLPAIVRGAGNLKNPSALLKVMADRGADYLREHFAKRNKEPNKRNWPKTGFWADIAQSTVRGEPSGQRIDIIVSDRRYAMQLFGKQKHVPVEAKALTIPLDPRAVGKRASVLADELGTPIFRRGNALAANINGQTVNLYALVRSVKIPADPEAFPATSGFLDALSETVDEWLDMQAEQGGNLT